MASRAFLAALAILCVAHATTGRKLYQDNSGAIAARTRQAASNLAVDSNDINQTNANQNAQAAGNGAAAGNVVDVAQQNDDGSRKLLQANNGGTIIAYTTQDGQNLVIPGRKLSQNSGVIVADTRQRAANTAVDSNNVNQANANQNAQAAGNGAAAGNVANVAQSNDEDGGRKLLQANDGGTIIAYTTQDGENVVIPGRKLFQANNGGTIIAYTTQDGQNVVIPGRKLSQNSGVIVADTRQRAANAAVDSNNVNQANANQNAQAAGNGAAAGNAVLVGQLND